MASLSTRVKGEEFFVDAATLTGRRSLFSVWPDVAPGAAPGPEEGRVEAGAILPEDEAAEAEDIPGPSVN